ncbi:tetratricopeptide repeat protein [Polynucleobacter sp. AP-Sanab-80-C2]|uniref:tetratricopeptide repeat protein n=1 Tax=Polynucleobacter sp. AP-Sanab-80-C2 TaxID=3108274 RepID=UPI002B225DE6|nr:tetratricopeptide repeat protein [Polynucleobacter sp. AP-Sanab-80-C2]MEA9598757.1 tetratricopeptide repeat protein [Polynucleobacter sp. AP-Sanab-80-C2]
MLNQAIHHFQSGKLPEAERLLNQILGLNPSNPPALQILGLIKATQGSFTEASKLLKKASKLNPNDLSLLYNLAKVLSDSGEEIEAILVHEKLIKLDPNNINVWINYSKSLANAKKFPQALNAIEKVIQFNQNNAEAWNNKGAILKELGQIDEALEAYAIALSLNPLFAEPLYNQGIALMEQEKYLDAINCFDKALGLKPNYFAAFNNKGIALTNLVRHEEALLAFDRALSLKNDYVEGSINKAVTLMHLRKFDEAIKTLSAINELIPNNSAAWNNKGAILLELKRHSEALYCFEKAIQIQPLNPEALVNLGQTLVHLKRFDEAIPALESAYKISPDYKALQGLLLGTKMQICNWKSFSQNINSLHKTIDSDKVAVTPFTLLSLTGDETLHRKAAINYINSLYPSNLLSQSSTITNQNGKIKLGYYSADFHNHATGYLMAELFELHDKENFELFAFSFGPNKKDEMQIRISSAFDHFIYVGEKSDIEIANISRDFGIQIAVDLKGFTLDSRPGIFANRAAPIQISYLGYPGTMGADYIDYIIADRVVIPEESQHFYTEKVLYLPNCYQVNDSKREISSKQFTRSEFGLPDEGFVYCCFNNNYKISPDTFKTWMNILKRVPNSVLWLFEDNEFAAKNLQLHAESLGIKAGRLIFAKLIPLSEHLARHHLADLFLDTIPYNAHTTASDALWSGLPVLTLHGSSFAGRVSTSLLTAIGLKDLITNSPEEYENLAVSLANNPKELNQLRTRLMENKKCSPLFNPQLFAKDIENLYINTLNNSLNA